ncbi:PAS domain-containing protein [Herbaspirillum sp. ST 5-3]|uniref:sensor histidine kinase n=1 Tax=Oxalobacteraceae TaxID=75682 RepID=UPI0010A3D33B|nr:PAS domain-containing protein [Herbaspirillum sp. ST 5-3]
MYHFHRLRAYKSVAPILTFAVCLAATTSLSIRIRAYEERFEHFKLEQRADAHVAAIRNELEDVMHELELINHTLEIFGPMNEKQFESFLQPIFKRYPHIENLSTAPLADGHNWPAYQAVPRVKAAPSTFSSRGFQRVGETNRHRVFNVTLPVLSNKPTRNNRMVLGHTTAVVDVDELVSSALLSASLPQTPELGINVHAHVFANDGDLISYRKDMNKDKVMDDLFPPLLQRKQMLVSRSFDAAGAPWHLTISSQATPFSPGTLGSELTMLAGVLFSAMIGLWMHVQASRASHIQSLVVARTAELSAINARLTEDIAARERAEEDLWQAQQVLTVAQKLGHLGSWEINAQTGEMKCSDELFRIFGLEPQSVTPTLDDFLGRIHPEDRDAARHAMAQAREEGRNFRMESRIVRPDGTIRYTISVGEATRCQYGRVLKSAGSMLDITEQKQTELALRDSREDLRELAAHQERIREDERKRIAREVHDALGSVLAGIKAYLSVSISRASDPDRLLTEASGLVDRASQTVREVVSELRPSVIDQLGVWEALRWYSHEIERRTQMVCECIIDENLNNLEIDAERSIAIFRIVQEALTNVQRHAHAWWATVRATLLEDTIVIEIEDNGKGSDFSVQPARQSWGIVGMHERARYFGGEFDIVSIPDKGTIASLRLPLNSMRKEEA